MVQFCEVCRPVHERFESAFQTEEHLRELVRRLVRASTIAEPVRVPPGWRVEETGYESAGSWMGADGALWLWATDPPRVESLVSQLARLTLRLQLIASQGDEQPGQVLSRWNEALLSLRLDPPVLVGAIVAKLGEPRSLQVARAGLLAPLSRHLDSAEDSPPQASGEFLADFQLPQALIVPGPYLGSDSYDYPTATVPVSARQEWHLPGWTIRGPG